MKAPKIKGNPSFGGRIKPKEDLHPNDLCKLELIRCAAVYKRFSTHEQVQTSRFSMEKQNRLEKLAVRDGYKSELSPEEIEELKAQPDYPGYYWNGQIVVLENDLGISGTKGQEDRPGLAFLIRLIEQNKIESVYVVDVTRLFRDSGLITAPAFARLCQEYGVIIIAEG